MSETIDYELGSGNVYTDLGRPDAEERLWKAKIVSNIGLLIESNGLTQAQAAKRLGITVAELSELSQGHFADVSIEQLLRYLNALDQDVEIVISHKRPSKEKATVRIVTAS